jgi:heat shock protein HslJ
MPQKKENCTLVLPKIVHSYLPKIVHCYLPITPWILSYIQDTKTNAITKYPNDAFSKISIEFTDSLNYIFFDGICNGGIGTYTYSSSTGAIKISGILTTAIACKYVEWEEYTTQNLDSAFNYKINGNNLAIYSNGVYNLYFTKN